MRSFLRRMEYPCTVDDLRHQGRRESLEELHLIELLPQRTYSGAHDVLNHLSEAQQAFDAPPQKHAVYGHAR